MDADSVVEELRKSGSRERVEGMKRYGITVDNALGVSVPELRKMARATGADHFLALRLWDTGIHDARILASMVDDPAKVTEKQMDRWVGEFDSWDLCDSCCGNLFDRTSFAFHKALEWSRSEAEYVRRAGFVMMAELAVHDNRATDEQFIRFFGRIREGSEDRRNLVKKAVNWALRQIGKRNAVLNSEAVKLARELKGSKTTSARWVGSDAFRELTGAPVKKRLRRSS